MEIVFMLVIRFSGEHAPLNEMWKRWETRGIAASIMRNGVVGPITLIGVVDGIVNQWEAVGVGTEGLHRL